MAKVLITGGSGLIGTRLTEFLQLRGFEVSHLGRNPGTAPNGVITFQWDYNTNTIDTHCFAGVDYVINLAGADVSAKRWSVNYKNEIYKSRVRSTRLLIHALKITPHRVRRIIQASAIGLYKNNSSGFWNEHALHGNEFLSDVCMDWEQAANEAIFIKVEPIILRIGVVLTSRGGFIAKVTRVIRSHFGAIFGSGRQQISWIHLDDLCQMFIYVMLNDKAEGSYNAVSREPISQSRLMKSIAARMGKSIILPKIPGFILRLIFGGFSTELLSSHHLSSNKILESGFSFTYPDLENALDEIFPDTRN